MQTQLETQTQINWQVASPFSAPVITESDLISDAINAYQTIGLKEMDGVALLNRTDTKYVLTARQLLSALRRLTGDYRVLAINQQRIHHYRTLYYDTRDFELYYNHVTGRAEIFKVRSREYVDTRISFLEVKHKNSKKRTEKSRMPIPCNAQDLDDGMEAFLCHALPVKSDSLEPRLWNTFRRITLVSLHNQERLTIDLDLSFSNGSVSLDLDGIVIAEVKQEHYSLGSAFINEMRRMGVRQTGFSKYCYGVAQLYPQVKKNSQKERALLIHKLQRGGINDVCYS